MKKVLLKIAAVVAIVVGGLELLGNVAALALTAWLKNRALVEAAAASAGIIGGADGPTAVFVTGVQVQPTWLHWLLPVALVAAGIWGLVCLKKCNK